MKPSAFARAPTAWLGAGAILALAACGGGAGDSTSLHANPPVVSPSTPMPSPAQLALPSTVANGSVLALECGRSYHGTLDLRGKSDVTVRTVGSCGNAILSPGQAVSGWTRHQGNIYSAPVSFDVAQVIVDGQPLALAHWPNRPQTWARANSSSATTLGFPMPNADLAGATLVFKPHAWAVEARRITGYAGSVMSVATLDNINFDGYPLGGAVDFYVEGKLWMLDTAGEWAYNGGRLYLWAPDGLSPEGRTWAAPARDGIDATHSRRITIEGVTVYGAANGINALNATGLRVSDASIVHSSANAILNSGGSGLVVERSTLRNSRHDAIAVKWGGGGETIRHNRIEAAGAVGMPTNAHAAINLTLGSGAVVQNNVVSGSGYIGIRVFRNAVVSGNTVDGACLVLSDCGGIYADAAIDRAALNTRIENNTITGVGPDQRLAWGIFLGEHANAVTVSGNTITASGNGIQILNAYDNRISGNSFARNTLAHIQMVEHGGAAVVTGNAVSGNTFTTTGGQEMYRLSSELGTAALARFGSYAANSYRSNASIFANYNAEALSFAQWRTRTGQDGNSTLSAP